MQVWQDLHILKRLLNKQHMDFYGLQSKCYIT